MLSKQIVAALFVALIGIEFACGFYLPGLAPKAFCKKTKESPTCKVYLLLLLLLCESSSRDSQQTSNSNSNRFAIGAYA